MGLMGFRADCEDAYRKKISEEREFRQEREADLERRRFVRFRDMLQRVLQVPQMSAEFSLPGPKVTVDGLTFQYCCHPVNDFGDIRLVMVRACRHEWLSPNILSRADVGRALVAYAEKEQEPCPECVGRGKLLRDKDSDEQSQPPAPPKSTPEERFLEALKELVRAAAPGRTD